MNTKIYIPACNTKINFKVVSVVWLPAKMLMKILWRRYIILFTIFIWKYAFYLKEIILVSITGAPWYVTPWKWCSDAGYFYFIYNITSSWSLNCILIILNMMWSKFWYLNMLFIYIIWILSTIYYNYKICWYEEPYIGYYLLLLVEKRITTISFHMPAFKLWFSLWFIFN